MKQLDRDFGALSGGFTRRDFVGAVAAALAVPHVASGGEEPPAATRPAEPVIDIHQHTHYSGRTDEELIEHQRRMGVTMTILLPAGSVVQRASTLDGKANGLQAQCFGNDSCVALAKQFPESFKFFANEVPDLPTAREEITKYLKLGGLGVGEQKFNVDVDSPEMQAIYDLAAEMNVPVLMHFQHETYNKGIERFGKVLERNPKVTFIGHAQTFWANVDKDQPENPKQLYPKTKVTPGGLTDQYLTQYPNLFADMSAGSGLNFLNRDEEFARDFIRRHQDRLLYGSDCNDRVGHGPTCQGWMTIQAIRKLAATKAVERKVLNENAKKLFRL